MYFKIKMGLMRAHKDCHDTKYELLELWVNEVYRAYFEKIPMDERPGTELKSVVGYSTGTTISIDGFSNFLHQPKSD